jgi:hypothetical protein
MQKGEYFVLFFYKYNVEEYSGYLKNSNILAIDTRKWELIMTVAKVLMKLIVIVIAIIVDEYWLTV